MRSWLYSGLLGFTFLCVSCVNPDDFEIDSVTLNPTLDLPLAFGQLQIIDILNDDDSLAFRVDEDGLLFMAYNDELISEDVRGLFEIPDLAVEKSFVLAGAVIPPHNNDITADVIQSVVEFPLSPEKLDEISLNSGKISYSVDLTPSSSNLDYEVLLVLDGFKSKTTNNTFNQAIEGQGEIDISEYDIALDDNKFDMKLVLIFKKTNATTTIAPATAVNVNLNFEGLEFDYIKGFFGEQVTPMEARTIPVSMFERDVFRNADVSLAQPRVNLTVYNENGVPCTIDFITMQARKEGAEPIGVVLSPSNPVSLASPTSMGDTKITEASVVNVKELMDYAPSEIFYQADVRINKGITSGNNFMIDSSAMKVRMTIEVPLWGSATGVVLQDTLAVDLEQVESSQVASAKLKLNLVNQLPLGGNVQFILTDADFMPLGTLLLPEQMNVIQASTVDASGELEAAGEYNGLIDLDQIKIENLFKAKHLILMANLQTTRDASGNAGDVKFKAEYGLSIKVGIVASLKLTIE